jgi:hypothetical protein
MLKTAKVAFFGKLCDLANCQLPCMIRAAVGKCLYQTRLPRVGSHMVLVMLSINAGGKLSLELAAPYERFVPER